MKKQTWRTTRKEHISGSRIIALFFILLGLICLAVGAWPLTLILFVLSHFSDSKHQRRHLCCYCGNTVPPTSLICPTCGADESTAIAEAEAEKAEKARAAALKKHPHLQRK
jgi:predicted amidophosphoribosyltransferase